MTRARSLLHAAGVFAAVLAVGFMLTIAGAWLARGLADSLAGAAVVIAIAAFGVMVTVGSALGLAINVYIDRRNADG